MDPVSVETSCLLQLKMLTCQPKSQCIWRERCMPTNSYSWVSIKAGFGVMQQSLSWAWPGCSSYNSPYVFWDWNSFWGSPPQGWGLGNALSLDIRATWALELHFGVWELGASVRVNLSCKSVPNFYRWCECKSEPQPGLAVHRDNFT